MATSLGEPKLVHADVELNPVLTGLRVFPLIVEAASTLLAKRLVFILMFSLALLHLANGTPDVLNASSANFITYIPESFMSFNPNSSKLAVFIAVDGMKPVLSPPITNSTECSQSLV